MQLRGEYNIDFRLPHDTRRDNMLQHATACYNTITNTENLQTAKVGTSSILTTRDHMRAVI
jgi:hypothetical protein